MPPATAVVFKLQGVSFADARDAAALSYSARMVWPAAPDASEATWLPAPDGIAAYAGLSPGRYRFEARALGADALYSATAVVTITVPEPPAAPPAVPPSQP